MSDHVKEAAQAHTTLCLFEAACGILECSDIRGYRAQEVATKVIRLLRKEQQNLLRDYDRAALSTGGRV